MRSIDEQPNDKRSMRRIIFFWESRISIYSQPLVAAASAPQPAPEGSAAQSAVAAGVSADQSRTPVNKNYRLETDLTNQKQTK